MKDYENLLNKSKHNKRQKKSEWYKEYDSDFFSWIYFLIEALRDEGIISLSECDKSEKEYVRIFIKLAK